MTVTSTTAGVATVEGYVRDVLLSPMSLYLDCRNASGGRGGDWQGRYAKVYRRLGLRSWAPAKSLLKCCEQLGAARLRPRLRFATSGGALQAMTRSDFGAHGNRGHVIAGFHAFKVRSRIRRWGIYSRRGKFAALPLRPPCASAVSCLRSARR